VDLLCDDARVAVELDGAQHLSDPAAYRRDRRKDQLLQENGYLVLRFLAEDIGKELSLVLDSILRVVNQRGAVSSAIDIITVPAALRTSGARASR
jgi:very-short-patch-repair endonuclease